MDMKDGYKQTEAGVIPKDWGVRALGALIASLEAGVSVNSVDKDKHVSAHDWSILKTSSVIGGNFIPEECKPIAARDIGRAKVNPRKDTILLSRMNTPVLVGECGYVDRDYPGLFLPDRLWMTRHDNRTPHCVRWLAYLLSSRSFNRVIKESATGTSGSMKNISKGALLAVRIPFPPTVAEQEAIAEALSDADALIESLEQLLAKKRQIKQGAMQELLTGKKRLPGFEVERGYEQTESRRIPKDWDFKPISQIAPLQRGFDLPTAQLSAGPYPVVYSNGVMAFHIRAMVRGPGVVTGRSGTLGKVHYVATDFWPHNTSLWVTRFNGNNEKFIYYLYNAIGFERFASGSGVPTLNRNDAHAFYTALPRPNAEQKAIAAILSDMDEEMDALDAKLTKARQIKQGMMQELLTGRIRLV